MTGRELCSKCGVRTPDCSKPDCPWKVAERVLGRKIFHDLEDWKQAARDRGFKVRKVTRSKTNEYWQASNPEGHLEGFFNTNATGAGPGGELNR